MIPMAIATVVGILTVACQPMDREDWSVIDHFATGPVQSTIASQRRVFACVDDEEGAPGVAYGPHGTPAGAGRLRLAGTTFVIDASAQHEDGQHAGAAPCVGSSCERVPALTPLIDVLGSDVPLEQRREASRALVAAGKAAIPVLLRALDDARVYERRDIANRMNLPPHAPLPPPLIAEITVGEHCANLLYEIITPRHASPYAGNFKVYSEQVLRVEDWQAWWAAHEHKSLAEIHAELQPIVDAYWQQHGTTQTVSRALPQPSRWEQGFPIPPEAHSNASRGGATSLSPGHNYTLHVYEVDASLEVMAAFYTRYLPKATRSSIGAEWRFSTPGGYVQLMRSGQGTRITLVLGPR